MKLLIPALLVSLTSAQSMSNMSDSGRSDSSDKQFDKSLEHEITNNQLALFIILKIKTGVIKCFQDGEFLVIYKGSQYGAVEFAMLFCGGDREFVTWIAKTERRIEDEVIERACHEVKS
jgi:hypothetical protein